MKNSINIKIGVLVLFLVISGGCTKLDQQFYDKVTPETFFKSKKDIMAALYRPFTHARWYLGDDRFRAFYSRRLHCDI